MKKTSTLTWLGAAAMLLTSAAPAFAGDLTLTSSVPAKDATVEPADLEIVQLTFSAIQMNNTLKTSVLDKVTLSDGHKTYSPDSWKMKTGLGYIYSGGDNTSEFPDLSNLTIAFYFPQAATFSGGTYTLTIAAGTVGVTNTLADRNNEFTISWTVEGEAPDIDPFENNTPVVTPAEGTVESLKDFHVVYSGDTGFITTLGQANTITLSDGAATYDATSVALDDNALGYTVSFDEVTEAGNWTLSIPAGFASDGSHSSALVTASYVIAAKVDPFETAPALTPADNSTLPSISTIAVKYAGAYSAETVYGDLSTITLTDGNSTAVHPTDIVKYDDNTGYELSFAEITAEGTYTLAIPAGFLKDGDKSSQAVNATYTVKEVTGPFSIYTSDPAAGKWAPEASWAYITVSFPQITEFRDEAAVINKSAIFIGSGSESKDDVEKTIGLNKVTGSDITCLTVRGMLMFSATETPLAQLNGNYRFILPAGTITLQDGTESPEIAIPYVLGDGTVGVESVIATDSEVTVYDLTGRQLLKNADASALRTLSRGLYIVNGKKVRM